MAFPEDKLDIKTELYYNSTWNDITSYVRAENGIKIKRGRTDSNYALDPSTCDLTLDNRDGTFTPRNPASPLYGKAGRNAPIRVSIPAVDPSSVLNSNPDFETNATGWVGFDASVARSTDYAHEGSASLKITPSGGTGASCSESSTLTAAATASTVYMVGAWLYSVNGWSSGVQVGIAFYNSSGTLLSASYPTAKAISASVWSYRTHTATAPASTAYAAPRVRINGTPTTSDILYADKVELRQLTETSYLRSNYLATDAGGFLAGPQTVSARTSEGSIDPTADIDVRIELDAEWYTLQSLCRGVDGTTGLSTWSFQIADGGYLWFGQNDKNDSVYSTKPLPELKSDRMAVRVTYDADNGASGRTITFYYSDSISGSWTQLGDAVTYAGTATWSDTTDYVCVGGKPDLRISGYIEPFTASLRARVFKFEYRTSIGGSLICSPDFTIQQPGVRKLVDAQQNTWVLHTDAEITDRLYRFYGEISEWPQKNDPTGNNRYVDITASSQLRRIRQNETALKSAMYRALTNDANTVAYWPMEEDDGASRMDSPITGCPSMTFTRGANTKPDLHTYDGFGGSEPLPSFKDTYFAANVPAYRNDTTGSGTMVRFLMNVPSAAGDGERIATIRTTGSAREWRIFYEATGNAGIVLYDESGDVLTTFAEQTWTDWENRDVQVGFGIWQDGTGTSAVLYVGDAESGDWKRSNKLTQASSTAGVVTHVDFNAGGGLGTDSNPVVLGHVAVQRNWVYSSTATNETFDQRSVSAPPHGWVSDSAGERFAALCTENGFEYETHGCASTMVRLSSQRAKPLSELLVECCEADDGLFIESRERLALGIRAGYTLVSQAAKLTLSYTDAELSGSFGPVDDDNYLVNDVTAKSITGDQARVVSTVGDLSTADVGTYGVEKELNIEFAPVLKDKAYWALRLGTLDKPRYPEVTVDLARTATQSVRDDVIGADLGDLIVVDSLPSWIPGENAKMIIQGYEETLNAYEHTITFNCSPGEPYDCAVVGTDRYDSEDTYLRSPIGTTDTSMDIIVKKGPLWYTSGGYDIALGGEKMTVSSVTGTAAWGLDVRADFDNTSTTTWNPSTTGNVWSSSGGGCTFAQNGSWGLFNLTVKNSAQLALIKQNHSDVDFKFKYALPILPTGDDAMLSAVVRYADDNNFYEFRSRTNYSTRALTFEVHKRVSGTWTQLVTSTSTGLTMVEEQFVWVRVRALGTSLKLKFWVDGEDEPSAWTLSTTDSSLTSGNYLCVRTFLFNSFTGSLPYTMYVGSLSAGTPQTMTVTRSVNSVVTAHETEEKLTLYDRPYRGMGRTVESAEMPMFDWHTGENLGSLRSPATVSAEDGTNIFNISATWPGTPQSVGAEVGVRFMAPLTGRILLTIGGAARDNTNTNRVKLNPDIYRVRGTDNYWANVLDGTTADWGKYGWASSGGGTSVESHSVSYAFTDLVPGQLYYARVLTFADTSTSASADCMYRHICVEPLP